MAIPCLSASFLRVVRYSVSRWRRRGRCRACGSSAGYQFQQARSAMIEYITMPDPEDAKKYIFAGGWFSTPSRRLLATIANHGMNRVISFMDFCGRIVRDSILKNTQKTIIMKLCFNKPLKEPDILMQNGGVGMEVTLGTADLKQIFHTPKEAYALLWESEPGIGKATIHRVYHLLMELGFARRLEVGDGLFRYEICTQNSGTHTQHHLICSE